MQRENRSLPGWAIVSTNALRIIVVTTLENLLLSSGKADLLLAKKHRNGLGFSTVANLIDNFLNVLNSSKIKSQFKANDNGNITGIFERLGWSWFGLYVS